MNEYVCIQMAGYGSWLGHVNHTLVLSQWPPISNATGECQFSLVVSVFLLGHVNNNDGVKRSFHTKERKKI